MLRRNNHVRRAEQRVRPRRVHAQHIARWLGRKLGLRAASFPERKLLLWPAKEIDLSARALADPIALQFLDAVRPIECVEACFQPLGVVRDP